MNGSSGKSPLVVGPRDKTLRHARVCYDHLAGRVAVSMADRMVELGHVEFSPDGGVLTKDGAAFLLGLGVNLDLPKASSRPVFCRPCLDWSERRSHIARAVGSAICNAFFPQGWIRRIERTRAVSITAGGHMALSKEFGSGIGT